MDEILRRDQNFVTVLGGVTDDVNQSITMLRVDPISKRLLVSATLVGMGTVTSITQGAGILLTPSPITTVGSVALATAIQPIATLGSALQSIRVNAGATALEYYTPSAGTGTVTSVSVTTANGVSGVVATATTTPAITLTLGAITPSTVNGNTFTTGTYTITGTAGKTLTFTNSITLTGTDAQTYTFPSTSATIARIDAGQTFTGVSNATSWNFTTPVLGTPTSGTLTNCTGYPVANIANLGTGIATFLTTPSSANLLAAVTDETGTGKLVFATSPDFTTGLTLGGVAIPTISSTNTFTNKYITPQLQSVADAGGTFTPVSITNDMGIATALSQATTIVAPTGSPVQGEKLIIRLKDNGTARALTWNSIYRASSDLALPTTTILSKTMYCGFIYNSTDTKWDFIAFLNNF